MTEAGVLPIFKAPICSRLGQCITDLERANRRLAAATQGIGIVLPLTMDASIISGLILLLFITAGTGRPNMGPRSAEEETNIDAMIRFLVKKLNSNERQLQMMNRKFDKMSGNVKVHSLLLQHLKSELRGYKGRKLRITGNFTGDPHYYMDKNSKQKFIHRAKRQAYSFLSPEILESLNQKEGPSKNETIMSIASEAPPKDNRQNEDEHQNVEESHTTTDGTSESTQNIVFSTTTPLVSTLPELKPEPIHRNGNSPGIRGQEIYYQDYLGPMIAVKTTHPPPIMPYDQEEEYEESGHQAGHSWGVGHNINSDHHIEHDEQDYGGIDENYRNMFFQQHPRMFGKPQKSRSSFKIPIMKGDNDYDMQDDIGRFKNGDENSEGGLSRKRRFQPMAIRAHDPNVEYTPEINFPMEPTKPKDVEEDQLSDSAKAGNAGIVWISKDGRKESDTGPEGKTDTHGMEEQGTLGTYSDTEEHGAGRNYQGTDDQGTGQNYPGMEEHGPGRGYQDTDDHKTEHGYQGRDKHVAGHDYLGPDDHSPDRGYQSTDDYRPNHGYQGADDHRTGHGYQFTDDHGRSFPGLDEHRGGHIFQDEHGVHHLYHGIDEHGVPRLYPTGDGIPYGSQIGNEYGSHLLPLETANGQGHLGGPTDPGLSYPDSELLPIPYDPDAFPNYPMNGDLHHFGGSPEDEEKRERAPEGSDESSDEDTHQRSSSESNSLNRISHMERSRLGDLRMSPSFNIDLYGRQKPNTNSRTKNDNSAQTDSGESSENKGSSHIGSSKTDYVSQTDKHLLRLNQANPDGATLLERIQAAASPWRSVHLRPQYDMSQRRDRHGANVGFNIHRDINRNRDRYNENRRGDDSDFERRVYNMNLGRSTFVSASNPFVHDTNPSSFNYNTNFGQNDYNMNYGQNDYDLNYGRSDYDLNYGQNDYDLNYGMSDYTQPGYDIGRDRFNPNHIDYDNRDGYNLNPGRRGYDPSLNRHSNHQRGYNIPTNMYDAGTGFNHFQDSRYNRLDHNHRSSRKKTGRGNSDELEDVFGTDGYYPNDSGEVTDEKRNTTRQDSSERKNAPFFHY